MTALKPYPAYKDSGVEWLGKVPEHWEVRGNRWLFRERNETGFGSLPIMEVSIHEGVRIRDMDHGQRKQQIVDRNQYKRAQNGDIAYNTMRMWQGAVGVVPVDGLVSPAYVVACPVEGVDPRYYGYLLRTRAYQQAVKLYSRGIVSDRDRLYWDEFKRIASLLPPQREQTAIVEFLDTADRRIRRYVRAKKRLIELLEELKRALIHEAVTGQIDVRTGQPYPAYKDSGIEWLGKVPEHWGVVQLGRIALERCDGPFGSGLKSSHYTDEGVRVVRLQNIGHGEFRNYDTAFISTEHYSTLGDHSVEPDDVLIAGLGDRNHPAGRACVAPRDIGPTMVKADCFRFRLDRSQALARFVALQLTATALGAAGLSSGATRQRINLSRTAGRRITLPTIQEQQPIIEYVTRENASTSMLQGNAERQIALLKEYRTRLIADVVTGKLDVRDAAADLPEANPFTDGNPTDIIHPASHPHSTEHGMATEAIP